MSKVFDYFSQAIKSCNVFTSPVNLRYKLDPDYNTVAGGIVSVALIVLLMSVFFNAWMELLNKEAISSSTEIVREFDPQFMSINSDDFMFAVGVSGLNLSDHSQKKYFNLRMTKYDVINSPSYIRNATIFNLQPCTQNHWEQLGDQFVQTYQRQGLNSFLCVPRNFTIDIAGKYTSARFIYYKVTFEKCVGSPDCRTQAEIDAWVTANTSFFFNFYYSNTLINPDQKEPLSMFFEDKDYTMFSPTLATSTNIYLGEYIMETDESIFPWVDTNVDEGFVINRGEKEFWNYMATPTQPYCKLFLRKSNVRLQIDRKFRKLDDMLSYIGGLFGIVAVFFSFLMNYYGQCCFELQMCQNIFDYHNKKQNKSAIQQNLQSQKNQLSSISQGKQQGEAWQISQQKVQPIQQVIEPKDFGFLDFVMHIMYTPLKKICNFKWKRMQLYDESLEQIRYKLDVSQLLQKLSFYDRSVNSLFDDDQLKLLYLQQKFNFEEVREERNMLGLRTDVVANLIGMGTGKMPHPEQDCIIEQKKTLKQISRSRKKVQSFLGPTPNILQIFAQAGLKASQQNDDDINLPVDIKSALKRLDEKISQGDTTSIRIYNGLQYELLQAFEKSKMKKTKHCVTNKNVDKKIKIKDQKRKTGPKFDKIEIINASPINSATSIQKIIEH